MKRLSLSRRHMMLTAAAFTAASTSAWAGGNPTAKGEKIRVVIVGGGFGGASAARAARVSLPDAEITLLIDQPKYWMCPGSNSVIAGYSELSSIEVRYDSLKSHGIDVMLDPAIGIDAAARTVSTESGRKLGYEKLILSPGVAFDYATIDGISLETVDRVPHAWKAGPQTALLKRQLQAMPDDGLFVMTMPPAPYRCPPAPAERACLVADYLKKNKPGARLLILDAKDEFPFQELFSEAWDALYPDILEYRSIADDGVVREVDPDTLTAVTDFDEIQADVLNVIPPQTAGRIAIDAGAADETGWCPVDIRTFASTLLPDVYVIGDAAFADPLPKAGSTAASQAHVAVAAIAAELAGENAPDPSWIANCYSLAAPDYGVRLGATYIYEDDHVVRNTTNFSELGAPASERLADAEFTDAWLQQIKHEIWG
ncbi:MAG: FAD-dependent oxidoreductase [Rhodospirillales bacterium]|nr:FAD-dependent oxidoreductase [Rhodospirillales bacterium]MBO6788678.1 FAD-dependent oxidoreductase [Rhodospirillales bacterium]